jgi:uncharacterized protein (DUF58 family)
MPFSLATLPHRLHRWLGIERRRTARGQAVTLERGRIFILPTAQGMLYAAITFVMLLGAANYNNSLAFILTFLLIALGLVALLQTYRNLVGLRLRVGRCPAVFCGEDARYEIELDGGPGRPRYAVVLQPDDAEAQRLDVEQSGRATLAVATDRRGYRPLGRLTLSTRYPLGLFRASARCHFEQACLVYPRPAEHGATAPRRSGDGQGRASQTRAGNEDFIGHRDYVPGDPPRQVDWKAAARSERLLSKRFGDHEASECWLDWNDHEGCDTETRLQRLCRAVLDAEARGLRYGLRLPGAALRPARGESHRHQCLRALALFGTTP